jgi:hypothetical protein
MMYNLAFTKSVSFYIVAKTKQNTISLIGMLISTSITCFGSVVGYSNINRIL